MVRALIGMAMWTSQGTGKGAKTARMSRSARLLELIKVLRRHRQPVSGRALADEIGVSIRTLYRDIATLQGEGAHIEGEAGLGYVLRPGFMLPPLMFSDEEIEAIVLGSRWVAKQPDDRLSLAAADALAKIAAVLPADLRDSLEASSLLVGPRIAAGGESVNLSTVRQAIRAEQKLSLDYRDANDEPSRRIIWPFALGFFEQKRVIAAWCETRQGFRHFRVDRITSLAVTQDRYPRRRQALLKEWRAIKDIRPGPVTAARN